MNFNNKSVFVFSLVCVALLTACSSEEDRREANKDFNYTDAKLHATLITPSTLKAPIFSNEYKVAVEQKQGPIAKDVDVRPPETVMPFVASSRPDTTSVNPKIWYSARSLNENISVDLWRWLKTFLQLNHYPIEKVDEDNKVILTGPISLAYEGEKPDDIPAAPSQKFRFKISDASQLHQSSVESSWVSPADDGEIPTIFKQRDYAAHLLNQFSAYTDTQAKNTIQYADKNRPVHLMLGTDSAGSKAIVAENPFGQTWSWLLTAMPRAGLPISYSSQSQGLIEFEYKSDDSVGFMDVLTFWKPEKPQTGLALNKGMYRLQLADKGSETSITLLDDSNKPVLISSVEKLYQRLNGFTSIAVKSDSLVSPTAEKPVEVQIVQRPIHMERKDGEWVADAAVSDLLGRTSNELKGLGWTIRTSDKESITVNYVIEEGSIFDALNVFKPIAPHYEGLANGEYIFKMIATDAQHSKVIFQDSTGKTISGPIVDSVLQALSNKLELNN